MSPFPLLRAPIRALFVFSFCILFLGLVSLWAVSQRASSRATRVGPHSISTLFQTEKGGITPAASTIVVNSTADVSNSTDGLCTLREAITAANDNVASGVVAVECAAGSTQALARSMSPIRQSETISQEPNRLLSNIFEQAVKYSIVPFASQILDS